MEPVALPERETMTAADREDMPAEQMASINRRSMFSVERRWKVVVVVPWVGNGFDGNCAALRGDNISRPSDWRAYNRLVTC